MSRFPSTARITSPVRSVVAAGEPFSIVPTTTGGSTVPVCMKTPARITKASTMLTSGPAPMTTIRFHTGWR